ncbi:hypothetical protein ACPF04_06240 [Campylobacter sp. MOP51]|uniref:hypothetical protein n=1 Tax=Campylobacter canis TaxID=3378588 RepID=UPI003C466D94
MTRYTKLGNIKIAKRVNGQVVFDKYFTLTQTYKDGENFVPFEGAEEKYLSLKVRLPFVTDLSQSFITSAIRFITINGIKYLAKEIDGEVYAFLLENNEQTYPSIISLGSVEKYGFLQLTQRPLLNLFVMNNDESDFVGGKMGIFMFKTNSINSFIEISNTLEAIKGVNPEVLRFMSFTLEMGTKNSAVAENGEVSYARLLPPSLQDVARAQRYHDQNEAVRVYLANMEKNILESMKEGISKAISAQQASQMFGSKLEILIDEDDEFSIDAGVGVTERAKEAKRQIKEMAEREPNKVTAKDVIAKNKSEEPQFKPANHAPKNGTNISEADAFAKELNKEFPAIPMNMIANLWHNFGPTKTTDMVKRSNNKLPELVKIISQSPVVRTKEDFELSHKAVS